MIRQLIQLDIAALRALNHANSGLLLDETMILVSSQEFWVSVFIITGFLIWRTKRTDLFPVFVFAILSLALADLISFELVKQWVQRERPCWVLDAVQMINGKCGGSYGFTSNHAANAGAVVMSFILSNKFSKTWIFAFSILALLVGISRVYLGVHYPGDVVGGYLLGAGLSLLLYKVGVLKICERVFKLRFL